MVEKQQYPVDVTSSKLELLKHLDLGDRVAEQEADSLANYFVETELWRSVEKGEVDVVIGAKGAGKSALHSILIKRDKDFKDRGISLVAAEQPTGHTAFRALVDDPPTSEAEFVALWKLYILTLVGEILVDGRVGGVDARQVKDALVGEQLLADKHLSIVEKFNRTRAAVRRLFKPKDVTNSISFDATTSAVTGMASKISFTDPSPEDHAAGARSVDQLLETASNALAGAGVSVWVLFDRLDVAFSGSPQLERNGLKALFKVYLDLLPAVSIQPKIFLRSDIWTELVQGGFREASHVTKQLEIQWAEEDLLNLVVRRFSTNRELLEWAGVTSSDVLADLQSQRAFFDSLVPEKVDKGNNPRTFAWILGRVQDGTQQAAPREVIHLLTEARTAQISRLDRGEVEPAGTELFSALAFRDAMRPVSKVRLTQTIYAEYPELRPYIEDLENEKAEQTIQTLMAVWGVNDAEARLRATRLVEIGIFEKRGQKNDPRYWVPFLYRYELKLVQGSAAKRQASVVDGGVSGP